MPKIYSLEELRELLGPFLGRYQADGASLFGSYARGEATANSDMDIIVHGGSKFDPIDVFSIAEDLHTVSDKRVDVYTDTEIDYGSDFGKHISEDWVALI